MLVCVLPNNIARETAGAARTRLSLRPLFREGGTIRKTPGASRRGNANLRLRICWHGTLVDVVPALSRDPYCVIYRFKAYCLATSRTTGGWGYGSRLRAG